MKKKITPSGKKSPKKAKNKRNDTEREYFDHIKCQGKNCKKDGCYSCGGYGFVLQKSKCQTCKTEYWMRPNTGVTIYDGKTVNSIDGLKIYYYIDKPNKCANCIDDKKEGG